ncbi:MAG: DUF6142 family protein [Lachnospiraceae bacterium]|nr:DUF6142 family protein [Lachnospiraceae bacterium]MDN4743514.1 DUF6142 family protein [Lachnospiraceae bacterium C1.1]
MFRFGKRRYLFTSSKPSEKGILSSILGGLSLLMFVPVIQSVLKAGGITGSRMGAIGFVSCLFSVAGIAVGVISLMEKDTYRFFPRLGFIVSLLMFIIWGGILYAGFIFG